MRATTTASGEGASSEVVLGRRVASISEAARGRGLAVLLADTLLMWGGFFMVIPLISVHYVDGLGWAAASVGMVLAIRQLIQQGTTPLSGLLADRLGAKGLICGGLLVRSAAFGLMAWADTFPLLLASAVLAAVGGGLFESPKAAAIAALTAGPLDTVGGGGEHHAAVAAERRNRYYALAGVLGAVGTALGTQIGALLLRADFALVALSAAGCFAVAFALTLALLPPVRVAATEGEGLFAGIGLAARDRPFIAYTALLMGYWFLWVQFAISLPLVASDIGGGPEAVAWMYGVNSAVAVLLGYPLPRLVGRRLEPLPALVLGVLVTAAGLGGVALAGGLPGLLACVAVFSVGAVLTFPNQQTVAAGLANPAALGSYLGLNMLALGIGGGLGNLGGGMLYDAARRLGAPEMPWAAFCSVGLLTATGLALLAVRPSVRTRLGSRR